MTVPRLNAKFHNKLITDSLFCFVLRQLNTEVRPHVEHSNSHHGSRVVLHKETELNSITSICNMRTSFMTGRDCDGDPAFSLCVGLMQVLLPPRSYLYKRWCRVGSCQGGKPFFKMKIVLIYILSLTTDNLFLLLVDLLVLCSIFEGI
jgi:hypothetical protein